MLARAKSMEHLLHLPIILEATWECRQFPLRELLALRAGTILPLRVPLEQPLAVRVGGATLGAGHIQANGDVRLLQIQQLVEEMQ